MEALEFIASQKNLSQPGFVISIQSGGSLVRLSSSPVRFNTNFSWCPEHQKISCRVENRPTFGVRSVSEINSEG